MRLRHDAIKLCDPLLHDDDSAWKEFVKNEIGCTPPYWNTNNDDNNAHPRLKPCASKEELNSLKSYWPMYGGINSNKVFNNYTRPCNKMTVFYNIMYAPYEKIDGVLKIKFRMQGDYYQEVLNIREFGMDDLWGG